MHRQLKEELTRYLILERQCFFTREEAQVVTVPLVIPWFSILLNSVVRQTMSLALHRCVSWLDAHYDIAATREKKAKHEGNQAHRTFWKFRRLLAPQLRDDVCRDIEATIYPQCTKSGVISPPVVGDSDDEGNDDADPPDYNDTSIPVAGQCLDSLVTASAGGLGNTGTSAVQGGVPSQSSRIASQAIIAEVADMPHMENLNGSITTYIESADKPSCTNTQDLMISLVVK